MKRQCPNCFKFIDIKDWPTYNGKLYSYCRECKRETQRIWLQAKRERDNEEANIKTKTGNDCMGWYLERQNDKDHTFTYVNKDSKEVIVLSYK